MRPADVSIAIPTYAREEVLLATLEAVLEQAAGAEVLLLDQTPRHTQAVEEALGGLAQRGTVRWLRLPRPSIPASMNVGLREATRRLVLFLDDDLVPGPNLVAAHAAAYDAESLWAVAGQVLQPGQEPLVAQRTYCSTGFGAFLDFPFHSTERAFVENGMAGNLSMRRDRALAAGGFDENFIGVAYRFETEFCRRLCRAGGRVLFEPAASIHHLRAQSGGTRTHGDHRRSLSPAVGVGDYYFALRDGPSLAALLYAAGRPLREVVTRYHLRRPWWIPVKLVGEAGACAWAIALAVRGPRLLPPAGALPTGAGPASVATR